MPENPLNPEDDSRVEKQLASLLGALNNDAAPPDRVFLDGLREQSTQVFRQSFSRSDQHRSRRRPMISMAMRVFCAAAAAAVVIGAWLLFQRGPKDESADSQFAFAKVLENMAEAQTVHVKIMRAGQTTEAWIKQPGQWRRDKADGTYEIGSGPKLWQVDEKANRASLRKSP